MSQQTTPYRPIQNSQQRPSKVNCQQNKRQDQTIRELQCASLDSETTFLPPQKEQCPSYGKIDSLLNRRYDQNSPSEIKSFSNTIFTETNKVPPQQTRNQPKPHVPHYQLQSYRGTRKSQNKQKDDVQQRQEIKKSPKRIDGSEQNHSNPLQRESNSISNSQQSESFSRNYHQGNVKNQSSNQIYKEWKVYSNKPLINMLPFPYCLTSTHQSSSCSKNAKNMSSPLDISMNTNDPKECPIALKYAKKTLFKLKIQNKLQHPGEIHKKHKGYKPIFNFEKTPINEYLNYELSDEINQKIRDVQMMADQIKQIKKEKKKVVSDSGLNAKDRQNKGSIRIRKSYLKSSSSSKSIFFRC